MGISREQALDCFRSEDLIGIGMEADAVRRQLHPEGVVSYSVERKIACSDGSGLEDVWERVREMVERGGTGVELEDFRPDHLRLEWLERLLAGVKEQHPGVWLQGLSPGEIVTVAGRAGSSIEDALWRLRDAGLDSISAGAMLGESGGSDEDWARVHRAAHGLGLRTVATMLFGAGEPLEMRVARLGTVRALQGETGGFSAFRPLSARAGDVPAAALGWEEATSVEYLKTLAISRMFLDEVEQVQASWETQGLKVLQMALRFGADDVGAVGLGGEVALGSGATEEELRRLIRDAGFRPAERDMGFRMMFWD